MESIFKELNREQDFYDRFLSESALDAVTIIIPVIHVNPLWKNNLISIYREIPVFELIIGNSGCDQSTLDILGLFPRVKVLDQTQYKTLGFSLRKMIEEVQTDDFIYLHSDVYLPKGWFDDMAKYRNKYEWFGCKQRHVIMLEQDNVDERPYWGSQWGKKAAFSKFLNRIEDDFIWRQEDFVLSKIVKDAGFKEGRLDSIFHYHQTMAKSSSVIDYSKLRVEVTSVRSVDEDTRIWTSQVKGIVKYLEPDSFWAVNDVAYGINRMVKLGVWKKSEIFDWIHNTNPAWLGVAKRGYMIFRLRELSFSILRFVSRAFSGCLSFLAPAGKRNNR